MAYIRHRVFEGYARSWTSPPREFPKPAPNEAPARASPVLSTSPTPTPTVQLPPHTPATASLKPKHLPPAPPPSSNPKSPIEMAEKELQDLLKQLHHSLQSHKYQQSTTLLSRAKVSLLKLNALLPSESTPRKHLALARDTLELGAIISIRLKDPVSFTRYFQQLQPFYSLPESSLPKDGGNASKITGLYLLLLLSDGDYAEFHTLLETLEVAASLAGKGLEDDKFIQYPIRLEQALMEGSYDRVWGETKSERVPSEEFALFSEVCVAITEIPLSMPMPVTLLSLYTFPSRVHKHISLSVPALTLPFLGPYRHHPQRNRLLQRKSVPLDPHRRRQIASIPRLGRQRRQFR
jgi:hypothetical protein